MSCLHQINVTIQQSKLRMRSRTRAEHKNNWHLPWQCRRRSSWAGSPRCTQVSWGILWSRRSAWAPGPVPWAWAACCARTCTPACLCPTGTWPPAAASSPPSPWRTQECAENIRHIPPPIEVCLASVPFGPLLLKAKAFFVSSGLQRLPSSVSSSTVNVHNYYKSSGFYMNQKFCSRNYKICLITCMPRSI